MVSDTNKALGDAGAHVQGVCGKCFLFQLEIQKQIIMAGPKRHPHDWAPRSFPSKPQKTKPHVLSAFLWTHLLFQLMGKYPLWPPLLPAGVPVGMVTLFAGVLIGKIRRLFSL